MARKNGLNRKEQIQCAKWLKEGVAPSDIAKKFKTSEAVVKLFTQEKLDSFAKKMKERLSDQATAERKRKEKAQALKDAMDDSASFA